MAPQITFVAITDTLSLPLKIFTKKTVTKLTKDPISSAPLYPHSQATLLSINEKSPITLINITESRLSLDEIGDLVSSIKKRVKAILYDMATSDTPKEQSLSKNKKPKLNQQLGLSLGVLTSHRFTVDGYDVVIPMDVIYQVRYKLRTIEYEDAKKYLKRDTGMELCIKRGVVDIDQVESGKEVEDSDVEELGQVQNLEENSNEDMVTLTKNKDEAQSETQLNNEANDVEIIDEAATDDTDQLENKSNIQVRSPRTRDVEVEVKLEKEVNSSIINDKDKTNKKRNRASQINRVKDEKKLKMHQNYRLSSRQIVGDFASCIKVYVN